MQTVGLTFDKGLNPQQKAAETKARKAAEKEAAEALVNEGDGAEKDAE